MSTTAREVQWTDLQRDPKGVAALADAGDVRVKRRDGADLILTRADRACRASEGAVTAARAFRQLAKASNVDVMTNVLIEEFPWIHLLPPDDLRQFIEDFFRDAQASAELEQWELLAQTVREWKATAAIYAEPGLAARLAAPITDDHGPVPSPMSEE